MLLRNSEGSMSLDTEALVGPKEIGASPLMTLFSKGYSDEKRVSESLKEACFKHHFSDYGRGVSFYRTTELYEIILAGLPDVYRAEIWLIFSGAIHQKVTNPFLFKELANTTSTHFDHENTMDEIERDL